MIDLQNKHKACETHCCIIHGCKYSYEDCPVCLGVVKQEYLCEDCSYDISELNIFYSDQKNKVDHMFIKENRKLKLKEIENEINN